MFMWHPDLDHLGDGRFYAKGWIGKDAPTSHEVANIITKYAASSCLWASGYRIKKNFRVADWMGLDFDEGMTLEEAVKTFSSYLHIIATTKSHQIEKNNKVCDRFRVFLRFGNRCTNAKDYEATARMLVKKFGADKACVDAARFFWPCREVVVCKSGGKVIEVVDSTVEEMNKKKTQIEREQVQRVLYPRGVIPAHIQNKLRFGVVEGRRNVTCYGIGADLGASGFSENEIMSLIEDSPILSNDFTFSEALTAVRSGMKKSQGYTH